MRHIKILFWIMLMLAGVSNALAQCDDGDNGDDQGEGGDGDGFDIPVLHAFDPNDITGPEGYDTVRWVSINDRMGYTIRFENDPEFATAPAQKVVVKHAIPETINPFTLQLGSFGFGEFFFDVPSGSTNYSSRLNVIDSLGVYVDITAGLDVANKEAFWIFQSIDPETGLASTVPANLGFLPVNDTTLNRFNDTIPKAGEGFVSFTVLPKSSDVTGDSVNAQANIFFDFNAPIKTNIWTNIIDALPPASAINPLNANQDSTIIELIWQGMDDPGGSGIAYYDLYVSANDAPFELVEGNLMATSYTYQGEAGTAYQFFTLATDNVGNSEVKYDADVTVTTGGRIDFAIKVLLEGPYIDSLNGMSTALNTTRHILPGQTPVSNLATPTPAGQPYNREPWDYTGTEGENWTDADYPTEAVDWVLISFRTDIQKNTEIAMTAALLLKDGTVEIPDDFNLVSNVDSMYLLVEHRNHIGVMTSQALGIENNTLTHNFTLANSYDANGTGSGQKQLPTGQWVMFAGDADQSDFPSYDILGADKIPWELSNGIFDYYTSPDLNMDADVNGQDKALWFDNNGISSRVPR